MPLRTSPFFLPYNPQLNDRARTLRSNPTPAEKKLWYEYLRKLDVSIHRQKVIQHFIVDFYIAKTKLVIEVDGDSHNTIEGIVYDLERTAQLQGLGIKVLRFTNQEVLQDFERVCYVIRKRIAADE